MSTITLVCAACSALNHRIEVRQAAEPRVDLAMIINVIAAIGKC
jgi:hypothetical protein